MQIKKNFYYFINRIKDYLELIKFEHTIFALPFALSGMLLASGKSWPSINTVILVLIAMISGRTGTMGLNRLIDANIDKLNPRTSSRAIPTRKIKKTPVFIMSIISFIILILAVIQLPLICIQLLPVALFILVSYSFTKRFTNMSHLVLGAALGASAAGGWLAVSGKIELPVIIFGLSVIFWVAGFDIIYAIQDINFDRKNKLFSVPAWLGIKKSLLVSKIFHFLTIFSLIILGIIFPVSFFYWIGILFAGGMLIYEHGLISENDVEKIDAAFFNVNGYVSIGLFICIVLDKIFG